MKNSLVLDFKILLQVKKKKLTGLLLVLGWFLEDPDEFLLGSAVSDRYRFGIGISRYMGLADMGKAYRYRL